MTDPIITLARRAITDALNAKGMKVGLPQVTISANHLERLCLMAENNYNPGEGMSQSDNSPWELGIVRSQAESEKYEEGRRDGFSGLIKGSEDPIYLQGYRVGVLEKLNN